MFTPASLISYYVPQTLGSLWDFFLGHRATLFWPRRASKAIISRTQEGKQGERITVFWPQGPPTPGIAPQLEWLRRDPAMSSVSTVPGLFSVSLAGPAQVPTAGQIGDVEPCMLSDPSRHPLVIESVTQQTRAIGLLGPCSSHDP